MSRLFIVLTAAGSGTRLGSTQPKALVTLGSQPLLAHALRGLPDCERVVVSAPPGYEEDFSRIVTESPVSPLIVPGGESRQASVLTALEAIAAAAAPLRDNDLVLVHDAARPFTPAAVFSEVVAALRAGCPAVIPATPVSDTIKIATLDESNPTREVVTATLNRAELRAVQTPQGFRLKTLLELHRRFAARAASEANAFGDDAALAEAAGIPVTVVPGSPRSLKITTPFDLAVAQFFLNH